jgi:DASH complex subunit DAD2
MASSTSLPHAPYYTNINLQVVKIPKPKGRDADTVQEKSGDELDLPQTLVRIPTEHAPMLKQQTEGVEE